MKKHFDIFGRTALILILAAAVFVSCSREPKGDGIVTVGGEVPMHIGITRGGGALPFEEAVKRVRIVIFGAYNSTDRGVLLHNEYFPSVGDGEVLKLIVRAGLRDIYLIVNEPLDEYNQPLAAYTGIASKSDVETLKLSYAGEANTTGSLDPWVPADFVMFESYPDYLIAADGSSTIGQGILRASVKATLNLNYKLSVLKGDEVVFDKVCVRSLPKWSWLAPRSFRLHGGYTGTLISSEMQKITTTRSGTGNDEKITAVNTFYLPEHILADEDNFSYFEIHAHLKNNTDAVFKYIGKIGDGINPTVSGSDRYDLTRNTHYVLTGNVVNYGDLKLGLEIEATILPWNKYQFATEEGSKVTIEKTYHRFTHNDGVMLYVLRNVEAGMDFRLLIEDPELFEISNIIDAGTDMILTVIPRQYTPGRDVSSKIYAVLNGIVLDQATVEADGTWRFTWAAKTIDLGGGRTLRIMDRNVGARSPKCTGNLFLRNTVSGIGTRYPASNTAISEVGPGSMWIVNSWETGSYDILRPDSYDAVMDNIVTGDNCPPGWRLPTEEEMTLIIAQRTPYGDFSRGSESGFAIPVMEGGEVYFPAAGFSQIQPGTSTHIAVTQLGMAGRYLIGQPDPNPTGSDKGWSFRDTTSSYISEMRTMHTYDDELSFASIRCVQDGY